MGSPRYAHEKGRMAARGAVALHHAYGFTGVETRTLKRAGADVGDLVGIPGVVTQIKWHNRPAIPAWLRATEQQRVRDGAWLGALWVRVTGRPRPEDMQVWLTEEGHAVLRAETSSAEVLGGQLVAFRGCAPAWLLTPHTYLSALAAAEQVTAPGGLP